MAEMYRDKLALLPTPVSMEVAFRVKLGYGVTVWKCYWCEAEWPCVDLSICVHPENGCLWTDCLLPGPKESRT